jgi:hypothetical protein
MSAMVLSALISLAAVLVGAISETTDLGLLPFVKFLLREIGEAGKLGLGLLVAVNVMREVVESQLNAAGSGLGKIKSAIEDTLGKMSTSVDDGLGQLSVKVEAGLRELKFDVHLERSWSPQEADQALRQKVSAPIAVSGTDEAKAQAEREVAEALLSGDPTRWKKVEELLPQLNNAEYYLRLAYKFWSVDRVDEGLKLAEAGLAISNNAPGISAQLKNTLAYFYAEKGRVDKKAQAIQYIREAREEFPTNVDFLETDGCVKIAFGTKEEAREGLKLCSRAAFAKGDDHTLNIWLERYEARAGN